MMFRRRRIRFSPATPMKNGNPEIPFDFYVVVHYNGQCRKLYEQPAGNLSKEEK